jgi:hypothetical protein
MHRLFPGSVSPLRLVNLNSSGTQNTNAASKISAPAFNETARSVNHPHGHVKNDISSSRRYHPAHETGNILPHSSSKGAECKPLTDK